MQKPTKHELESRVSELQAKLAAGLTTEEHVQKTIEEMLDRANKLLTSAAASL
jgi:hypothetical protein